MGSKDPLQDLEGLLRRPARPEPPARPVFPAPEAEAPWSLDQVVGEIDARLAAQAVGPAPTGRTASREGMRHVVFSLSGTRFALPLGLVVETGRLPDLTGVPNVPDWIAGVANLRGDVIAVLDLGAFLGLPSSSREHSRLVVVRLAPDEGTTGLVVERLHGLAHLSVEDVRPPTAPLAGRVAQYLTGVHVRPNDAKASPEGAHEHGRALLVVLDLPRLLRSPEVRQLDPH